MTFIPPFKASPRPTPSHAREGVLAFCKAGFLLLSLILVTAIPLLAQVSESEGWIVNPVEIQVLNFDSVRKAIAYPLQAIKDKTEGRVIFRIQINARGKYVGHALLRSPHIALTKACEAKIPLLRFSIPHLISPEEPAWLNVVFIFRLNP
ncbi:MAG: hypothetical protein H6581_08075 [Bacteroidia bacterium]|nr:hypothetical protein [Bacteroidia bacterium]